MIGLYRGLTEVAGWHQRRIVDTCSSTVVDFPSEATLCPQCCSLLRVIKTSRRRLVTLEYGEITAREIQRVCPACRVVMRSRRLAQIIPPGQRYGYDIVVWVGLRRWVDRLQRVEIRDRLENCYGIRLSTGTVSTLAHAGVPDLLCHFHVLKNLGDRLLKLSHRRLKARWERLRTGSTLKTLLRSLSHGDTGAHMKLASAVLWVLRGTASRRLPFPFRLPVLEQLDRLIALNDQFGAFVDLRRNQAVAKEFETLQQLVSNVANDTELATLRAKVRQRQQVFNDVRSVFRLVDPTRDEQFVLPEFEDKRIREIEDDLARYRAVLSRRVRRATGDSKIALNAVLTVIDRVKGRLFGHPAIRDANGKVVFVVNRTNNTVEHFFGRQNQAMRRRTGRKNLGRDLEDLPAEAALVHNLQRPTYVAIVLGSLDQLPARFASVQPLKGSLRPHPFRHLESHFKTCSQLLDPQAQNLDQPCATES